MIIAGSTASRRSAGFLPIAPSTYHHHQAVARDPSKASVRAQRDAELGPKIKTCWEASGKRYGAVKVWYDLAAEGEDVARCTVVRLMKEMGIQGVIRGKGKKTTYRDPALPCPEDKVNRDFKAPAPNVLWVADFTYVRTAVGFVYVAFIIDVFARYIVGWQVSSSPNTKLVLDALEQALAARNPDRDRLTHHSDRGVQYLSIKYSERLEEAKIGASVGSVGDSTTTLSPKPSTASTRPRSSSTKARGAARKTSSSQPWTGSIGTTTSASTARSDISHPQRQKGTSTTQNSRLTSPQNDQLQPLR